MAPSDQPHDADALTPSNPDEDAFVRGLETRGEAAERGADGSMPPGATHEILGRTESGAPIVRRVRFAGRAW